jgi:hypothetical protein
LLSVVGWESFMMNITWSPWVFRYNDWDELMMGWKQFRECVIVAWIFSSHQESIWVDSQSQQFNTKNRKDKTVSFSLFVSHLPHEVYITLITIFCKVTCVISVHLPLFLLHNTLGSLYVYVAPYHGKLS